MQHSISVLHCDVFRPRRFGLSSSESASTTTVGVEAASDAEEAGRCASGSTICTSTSPKFAGARFLNVSGLTVRGTFGGVNGRRGELVAGGEIGRADSAGGAAEGSGWTADTAAVAEEAIRRRGRLVANSCDAAVRPGGSSTKSGSGGLELVFTWSILLRPPRKCGVRLCTQVFFHLLSIRVTVRVIDCTTSGRTD